MAEHWTWTNAGRELVVQRRCTERNNNRIVYRVNVLEPVDGHSCSHTYDEQEWGVVGCRKPPWDEFDLDKFHAYHAAQLALAMDAIRRSGVQLPADAHDVGPDRVEIIWFREETTS